jgi:Holliday junction resolvasome RuvABC endonuclease subunit
MRICGVDTGFTATGLTILDYDGTATRYVASIAIRTEPTSKKRRLLVVDDHLRRIREIREGVLHFVGGKGGCELVAMEAFSQHRNAAAATRQAFGYAVAICVADETDVAVVQFTPQEIRKRIGVVEPTKAELATVVPPRVGEKRKELRKAALRRRVFDLLPGELGDGLSEHEYDAAAAVLACLLPNPVDIVRVGVVQRAP